MRHFLDKLPWPIIAVLCIAPGLAPFAPEPHIAEKIRMLINGDLKKVIDIFDLIFHSLPFILLFVKIIYTYITPKSNS